MKNIVVIAFMAFLFSSCNDFLQREPMDFTSEESYFNSVADLEAFNNGLYTVFPNMNIFWGGLYAEDNNSDNQVSSVPDVLFYKGAKSISDLNSSQWKFTRIRDVNYFLNLVQNKINAGRLPSPDVDKEVSHYIGEAYFFRAYEYYRLLVNYGDVPILKEVLPSDFAVLAAASKRMPRNEVARFIMGDLDEAVRLMHEKPSKVGRLSRDAALMLKARVALFEGTFLKHHKETAFVPGNAKWVGKGAHPDYQFPAGSIDAEIDFFLQQAIETSDLVLSYRPELHPSYQEVFNRTSGADKIDEIVFARYYIFGVATHSATSYLKNTGAGCGLTKSLVETFLCKDGLPIYKSPLYQGDSVVAKLLIDRDERLIASLKRTGYWEENEEPKKPEDRWIAKKPLLNTTKEGNPSGYELYKYASEEEGQDKNQGCTTSLPIFRTAEAMLIYLEAYVEKNGVLGGNCDLYWRKLRKRAGVEEDYTKSYTAGAFDFGKEEDLAKTSKGVPVSDLLYAIRRERRCEMIGEGMRLADLKRWRALDLMKDYVVKGMNLWGTNAMKKFYKASEELTPDLVSQASEGDYVCPYLTTGSTIRSFDFPKAHYLEPIPVSEIVMTAPDGDVERSPIYQNPGWSNKIVGPADYNADLD